MLSPPGYSPRYALGTWAFSFGPFAHDPWSFERVCRYTADAGYHGIEINGFRPHPHPADFATPKKCRELANFVDGLGLGIAAYAPDFSQVPPATETGAYLDRLREAVRFCERLDIRILRVDTVTPPDAVDAEAYPRHWGGLVHTWRESARICQDAGVTLAWEFEPGFWLNRPSEVKSLSEAIDHPAFRILFDTCHAHMCAVEGSRQGAEPEILPGGVTELARMLMPNIGHIHFIDSDGQLHDGETSIHAPFGTGLLDFPAVIAALDPVLWQMPWLGVDFCFCPTTEQAAREALPFLDRILHVEP